MPVKSWDSGAVLPPCCGCGPHMRPLLTLHHPEHSLYVACRNSMFPYRLKWIVISGGGSGGGSGVCIAWDIVAEARGSGVNSPFLPLCGS